LLNEHERPRFLATLSCVGTGREIAIRLGDGVTWVLQSAMEVRHVSHWFGKRQHHSIPRDVIVLTRNGNDLTRRFGSIAAAVAGLRAKSAIIDAELVACDENGAPNFYALMAPGKVAGPGVST
jgi:hypothetical protein